MAAPSISTYILSNSSHYYGSEGGAAVMTSPSDSVTKVSAIISQTSGGAAIETVETTVKTSSDLYADRWALTWPTAGITASPYYVRMWATNSDGDGAVREVAPYIYFPPSVSVTSPADGSTLTDSSVTMAWTATDDYGISYQRASVSHDGTELWGAEVEGNSIAVPSSVVFENGESYSFSVMARNGKGMEATATNTASFSFVAPSVPALVIAEGDGKSASITVTDSSYTESGTVLEASSSMMESLTIHGQSVQDGTPTPSAPVAIKSVQGWNLLDDSNIYNLAVSGNSIVSNANYRGCYCKIPTTTGDTKYTISRNVVEGNRFQVWSAATEPVSGTTVTACFTWDNAALTATFTVPANQSWLFVYLANNGGTFTQGNIQITAGAGRVPILPYGEIGITETGNNLLNPNSTNATTTNTTKTVSADGTVSLVATENREIWYGNVVNAGSTVATLSNYTNMIPLSEGESISVKTFGSLNRVFISFLTAGYTGISYSYSTDASTGATFTAPANCAWVTWRIGTNGAVANTTYSGKTMVVYGDTATAYEPYSSTTTPIPVTLRSLPDGTHDEWVSGESADTYIQRVGVLDGSSLTQYATNNGFIAYRYNPLNAGNTSFRCPLFSTSESFSSSNMTKECMQFSSVNDVYVALADTRPKTDFSLLYKLATPITTTLAHVNLPYVDGSAWVDAEVTPTIEATFRPVDFPGQPAADSVDVVRVNADGSTWTVASNLTMGDTVTDPLPPLGVDAVYKAVGKTSAGGMSEKLYMQEIPSTGWVLNFGDAAQETVGFIYNPQATMTLAQGGESYHFADGGMGGGFPVFYPTTDRDASGTLAFDTVLYGDSDRLLDLCRRYPVAWLRDPFGHRWRAHVRPSVSHGVGQVWPVTIAWDAVRFEEV